MKILLLAPQPFYTERGTPIAVRLAATALVRAGHRVDLLCYHEGRDIALEGLRIHRIAPPALIRDVPIGFSWKKLVCDAALLRAAHRLLRKGSHDVVHAVEEAVFLALALRRRHRFALVYDMDSLMAAQLTQKWRWLAPWSRALERFERVAARRSERVLTVCASLERFASEAGAQGRVHLLPDVAFPLPPGVLDDPSSAAAEDLRALFPQAGCLVLYVGNLEPYQGVDLLLEALAIDAAESCNLAVVGGRTADVAHYRARAGQLGIANRVRFTGMRPLAQLPDLLRQADILCSPRRAGPNTPMKIYSYMAAARAIVATAIDAHTQVLDADCALLVAPSAPALAQAIGRLSSDAALRARLGERAQAQAGERHSFEGFERRLAAVYEGLAPAATAAARDPPPVLARDNRAPAEAAEVARPQA